jgi:AbrB family looped-hinge helix DNA binding protein
MKIGERGQVTIPLHFRRRFGLKPAMEVEFVQEDGRLVLRKPAGRHRSRVDRAYGVLGLKGARTDDLLRQLRGA